MFLFNQAARQKIFRQEYGRVNERLSDRNQHHYSRPDEMSHRSLPVLQPYSLLSINAQVMPHLHQVRRQPWRLIFLEPPGYAPAPADLHHERQDIAHLHKQYQQVFPVE